MNSDFSVKWNKQRWVFKVANEENATFIYTYHGKIDNVFFLVKWNKHDGSVSIHWDDSVHTSITWFDSRIKEAIQTIMADRVGLSQYERHQKNYPTSTTPTPTKLHIGNAQIYVVRFTDNSRWWYESVPPYRDECDWSSKLFKPDIQPSQEHLFKQMFKGKFELHKQTEVVIATDKEGLPNG
jgi:hypothetical protein